MSSSAPPSFRVAAAQTNSPDLLITNLLFSFAQPTLATTYASVAGVYDQNTNYRLQPRGESDFDLGAASTLARGSAPDLPDSFAPRRR